MKKLRSDNSVVLSLILISIFTFLGLLWLIYFQKPLASDSAFLVKLPSFNALMNGLSATCIVAGVLAIKKQDTLIHKRCMLMAFLFSTFFLTGYVLHHLFNGDTVFMGEGWIRLVYFFVLISHVILTFFALPLVLVTFFMALTNRIRIHKKMVKLTFPIWLYISVTGVMIYFLLKIS